MCRTIYSVLVMLATLPVVAADTNLVEKTWTVDDISRQALLYIPASADKSATPVVFAFHGHGGTMKFAATNFGYHKRWPEAIVVYMQGLNTPGALTDPEGKLPGWQRTVGDQKDRDLKFFDEVLATLRKDYKVDDQRIYATGHSNGGGFTYLLWAARGNVFAAVAPAAAVAGQNFKNLKPLPALHVAGEKDEIVPFDFQKRTMDGVRKLDGCEEAGTEWAKSGSLVGTLYTSKTGTPFVSLVYPGTHKFPSEAPELIVKFFKEHSKKVAAER